MRNLQASLIPVFHTLGPSPWTKCRFPLTIGPEPGALLTTATATPEGSCCHSLACAGARPSPWSLSFHHCPSPLHLSAWTDHDVCPKPSVPPRRTSPLMNPAFLIWHHCPWRPSPPRQVRLASSCQMPMALSFLPWFLRLWLRFPLRWPRGS